MTCDHGQCVPKTDSFKANGSCNNDPFNETFASGKPFESLCINNVDSTFRLLKLGFNVFNSFGHQTSHDAASFKAAGNCKKLFLHLALVGYLTCALYYYLLGWDGMGYTVGTGVATAQKFAQRPTAFLPQHYRHFGQQGYSKKQTSPQSRVYRRVHTDRSDLLYYNIQIFRR